MILLSDNEDQARSRRRTANAELKAFFNEFGIESETAHMPFGDVSFTGNGPDGSHVSIGIELKTVQDFIGSMRSGRLLAHQLPGMFDHFDRRYVVIEGIYRFSRRNGLLEVPYGATWKSPNLGPQPVFWHAVEAFIVGLGELGVIVKHARTPYETAKTIEVVYRWWAKPYEEHTTLMPALKQRQDHKLTGVKRPNEKWVFAAGLPGVGWGRGKKVAEHFESNEAMVQASVDDWMAIDGIGRTIAQNIYEFFRKRSKGAVHEGSHGSESARVSTRRVAARRSHR